MDEELRAALAAMEGRMVKLVTGAQEALLDRMTAVATRLGGIEGRLRGVENRLMRVERAVLAGQRLLADRTEHDTEIQHQIDDMTRRLEALEGKP